MKRVLVTGGDGFIGSHLTELLVHEGYRVKALAQYNSLNHWGWLEDVDCLPDIEILNGDVRDSQADISKAEKMLGYRPTVGLEEGLRKTVDWFKSS